MTQEYSLGLRLGLHHLSVSLPDQLFTSLQIILKAAINILKNKLSYEVSHMCHAKTREYFQRQ